jgi:hypothetical protein
MIYLNKLLTPVYGTQTVPVDEFVNDLKERIKKAKLDNTHFGWKIKRFEIGADEHGVLWLVGFTNKDSNEV